MGKTGQDQTISPGKLIELQNLSDDDILTLQDDIIRTADDDIDKMQQKIEALKNEYYSDNTECPEDIQTAIQDHQELVQECEQQKQEGIETLSVIQNQQKELGGRFFASSSIHLFTNQEPAPAGKNSVPPSQSFGPKQA